MARKPRAASAATSSDSRGPGPAEGPATNFDNSPVFQAAVADAVAKLIPGLRDQILDNLAVARGSAPAASGDTAFAEGLAMAISQLGNQGVGRKHVAPEVLRSRAEARALMTQLIVEARSRGEIPRYQLRHKVFLDEMLVDPVYVGSDHVQRPTEIEWPGVPSEAMRPANEAAQRIFQAFSDSIGTVVSAEPERQIKVTAGGLVVHGRPIPAAPAVRQDGTPISGEGGLRVPHLDRPGQYKETRVLGTVAAPARQTA